MNISSHSPLTQFESIRAPILSDVVSQTKKDISESSLELLLSEALYSERFRLKRNRPGFFTQKRYKNDKKIWSQVQTGLILSASSVDRQGLLDQVLNHYAEEIGGHFDPTIYKVATYMVPWFFNWILNAASVQRFLPWGMTESLQSKLHILGEIKALQKLSKKGTILLVPTHQSNIDSVLIGYVIYLMSLPPFAYGAGLNLFSNPLLSFFMSRLGSYTVDRQKTNLIYKHILKNYSTRILEEGVHSIFFPGGGRSRSGAIETKLKLGLLGTGLQAQITNLQKKKPNPHIYVVPMVTSYHFVLEASSLIEDYLAESGKHRFIITDDESWQSLKVISFFWKLFSSQSTITMRVGKPLDIFGNFVDEEGHSIGPNQTSIDPVKWLTTRGVLQSEPQRDQEYVRELGLKLVERFHCENTVLSSHLVAFVLFETLRKQYPDLDLYRLLRITLSQRSVPLDKFLKNAEIYFQKLVLASENRKLYLSSELQTSQVQSWVDDGIKNLGLLHDVAVVRAQEGVIWTEDMNLLYYYRNRLSRYGL